jgi:hypothetical protein
MASDAKGNLYLVWMGYRARGADAPQSDILMRVLNGNTWSPEIQVTDTPEDEWDPALATGPDGKAWIAWDAYRATAGRTASYDLMLRSYGAGQLSPVQAISETSHAEMRADLAVDAAGRVWIAWEEGGAHWGKDTGYENPRHRITLRKGGSLLYGPNNTPTGVYRRPRIAVLENGQLRQPEASLEQAYPEHLQANLFQNPRLGVDGKGRVWVFLRHQLIARGRWAGHMFDFYATTLSGEGDAQRWLAPILIPHSTGRQDTVLAATPAGDALAVAVVGDGRRLPVGLPEHHDIYAAIFDSASVSASPPRLTAFQPSAESLAAAPHPQEAADVDRIRKHRITAGGTRYKIVRGDLHRHTEISMDGAIDGTIWDLYRYAINAAAFDYIAVTEHNNGAWLDTDEPESRNTDDIYQWWRIQKSADLFHVRGRFVPLYGFERSINFPLGHRNIIHSERGVFTLRVPKLHVSERPDVIEKDAQNLWSYLRATGGLAIPHTSGTSMGTDWRLRDDPLEPVTEIYQGDRNSYEEEGAPRAATKEAIGDGDAGRQPFQKGLIWNALGAGYKMGFIASSDHFSTHISYANLLVPDGATTREQIQDALRRRHTYASTDNIIVDFAAAQALQGDEIASPQTPAFRVNVIGTAPVLRVDIIKNNRVVYTRRGGGEFTFRDTAEFEGNFDDTSMAPSSQIKESTRRRNATSFYYVRAVQSFSSAEPDKEGEIAWSSPIFVTKTQ